MDTKSKVLLGLFALLLTLSVTYAAYRYLWQGDFLIDESQVETEPASLEAIETTTGEAEAPETGAGEPSPEAVE